MKTILLLVFVAAVANAAVSPEYLKRFTANFEKCAKREGIKKEEVFKLLIETKLPSTKQQKCTIDCYMHEGGYLKDGKVDWDYAKSTHKEKYIGEPENKKKADEVVEVCRNIVNIDGKKECEMGEIVLKCLFDESNKRQLAPPNFLKTIAEVKKAEEKKAEEGKSKGIRRKEGRRK